MKFGEIAKSAIKAAIIFGAVGLALGLASPLMAAAMGPGGLGLLSAEIITHVVPPSAIWLGAFFGAFGALDAVARPVIGGMLGEKSPPPARNQTSEQPAPCHNLTVNNQDIDIQNTIGTLAVDASTRTDFAASEQSRRAAREAALLGSGQITR